MPGATFNLSGSSADQGYVWLSYVSYDQGGNYSTWYWEAVFKKNGSASWMSDASHRWALSGFAATGWNYFGIPSSWAGTGDHMLGSGYFTKAHNSAGYLSAGNMRLTIETAHSGIGSGWGEVSSGNPPRIPKAPSAPSAPVFVGAEPDRLNFTIFAPSDNGGSAITSYLMQVLTENVQPNGADVVAQWTSGSSNQWSPANVPLDPATKYRVRYYAINGVGSGPWSPVTVMTTEAGIFVSDGSAWKGGGPRVSTGSAWASAGPQVGDADSFEDPFDVIATVPTMGPQSQGPGNAITCTVTVPNLTRSLRIQRALDAGFTQGVAHTDFAVSALTADYVLPVPAGPAVWFLRAAHVPGAGEASRWSAPIQQFNFA